MQLLLLKKKPLVVVVRADVCKPKTMDFIQKLSKTDRGREDQNGKVPGPRASLLEDPLRNAGCKYQLARWCQQDVSPH